MIISKYLPFLYSKLLLLSYLIQKKLFWITASHADATSVNLNGIKKLLANGLNTFFIKDKTVFSNESKGLPKNFSDCLILNKWAFHNFVLADELFTKASRSLKTLCSVIIICVENYSPPLNPQPYRMKDLKLPEYHLLFLILIYWVVS